MKTSIIFAVAFAITASATDGGACPGPKGLLDIHLPEPLNWLPGDSLYPGKVVDSYSAPFDDYTPDAWTSYVRDKCRALSECTTIASYSATGSGAINNTEDPFWFGWAFKGGKATLADFMRSPGIEHSAAYTVRG